ncbi:shikimate kinase [Amphibacillus sp. Q70]|uniref:shikimate kinase n=1 Tax=Amphibacillus sp. Q70 TaxID=3453416 RepID=UPI003F86F6E0
MNSIFLIGFMGSGKSTIGRQLAERLALEFIDTDHQIEIQAKKKIKTIFAEEGEEAFRNLEHQVLIDTPNQGYVIATGGGIIEREENRTWLTNKHVVYLKTNWETIKKRLANDDSRPIWHDQSRNKQDLLMQREVKYAQVASQIIETDKLTEEAIIEQIISLFV